MTATGGSATRLWSWWLRSVKASLADWMVDLLFGPTTHLELVTGARRIEVWIVQEHDRWKQFSESMDIDAAEPISRMTRRQLRDVARQVSGPAVLRLPADKALTTRINLPVAAAENLRRAIEDDLDRFTPFAREDVYFDFHVLAVDTETETIHALLQVARKDEVERFAAFARAQRIKLGVISGPAGTVPDAVLPNLLPPEARFRPRRILVRLVKALTLLVAALAMASVVFDYSYKSNTLEALRREVVDLRAIDTEVSKLEDELSALRAVDAALGTRRAERPLSVEAISLVARALTDDHWLVSLEIKAGSVSIAGLSADPATLLALLEHAPDLANARLTAPVTRDDKTGLSRFFADVDVVAAGTKD